MRFFHLGDLHIGKYLNGISLIEDQKYILKQIEDKVIELKPDCIIISGDIFDRSIPKEEAVALYDEFVTNIILTHGVPIYAISGNHDSSKRLSQMSNLLKNIGYYVFGDLTNPISYEVIKDEFGEVKLYFLPYKDIDTIKTIFKEKNISDENNTKIEQLQMQLDLMDEDKVNRTNSSIYRDVIGTIVNPNERNILVAHNFFNVSCENLETSDSERKLSIGGEDIIKVKDLIYFNYVALGHLHKAQKVNKEYIRYPGSPIKYSLSEINYKKSFPYVNLKEHGSCDIELIKLNQLRDIKILKGLYEEISSINFIDKKDDFFHVILEDTSRIDNAYLNLQRIYPNIFKLDYINIKDERFNDIDTEAIKTEDTYKLFKDFFVNRLGREISDGEDEIIKEILMEDI